MIKVSRYDGAELLKTKEHCIEYLNAAAEEDVSCRMFFSIMDDIVRSEGARASLNSAGLDASELKAALAANDMYDRFDAVVKILRALGARMTFSSVDASSHETELEYVSQAAP